MVINDKVAFIPIPKNASWSVENTCIDYKFKLDYPNVLWENSIKMDVRDTRIHVHSTIDELITKYGRDLEYVAIIRNSTDRFISAWKFFVTSLTKEMPEEPVSKIKNADNKLVIEFFKENYHQFLSAHTSFQIRTDLLVKLMEKLGVSEFYTIDDAFKKRFAMHIYTFVSQYQWVLAEGVTVKLFSFDKLDEFEKYMSDKFDVDFKLVHANKDKLDYCNVTKTDELAEFVEKYIDGAFKRTKSII